MSQERTPSIDKEPAVLVLSGRVALLIVALLGLCGFTWMAWQSMAFPAAFNTAEVGAARVPLIACTGGILSSIGLIVQAVRRKFDSIPAIAIRKPLGVLAALALTILWVWGMPHIGFYLASVIVVPLIMLAGGERRPMMLVLSAIGFVVFVHVCFSFLLDIEFP
ncbi:MAG TPA: tripartite tricarboxylate transporter TctB family protein [Advenella sp.]|nr:tripartite tricarboxylate transporter TctB family protein [Advenella sp.]